MSEDAQGQNGEEPSMEDILASIRRILSEDGEEAAPAEKAAPPAPAPEPEPEEEMDMAAAMAEMEAEPEEELDMAALMEEMAAEPEPEPKPEPAPMIELAEDDPEPEPEPEPVAPPPPPPPPVYEAPPPPPPPPPPPRPGGEPDISSILDLTAEMITTLPEGTNISNTIMSAGAYRASTDILADLARAILSQRELQVGGSDITLEGMVRQMMKPLLSEWLDQNLPYLIERLVKKEIDRMINRAERLED